MDGTVCRSSKIIRPVLMPNDEADMWLATAEGTFGLIAFRSF